MYRKILAAAVVAISVAGAPAAVYEGLTYSTTAVKTGVWSSQFTKCKEYADSKGVPLVVVWVNPGCGYCARLCRSLGSSSTFAKWVKSSGFIFVLGVGTNNSSGQSVYRFAHDASGLFPFCAVYLNPIGSVSPIRKKTFNGRNLSADDFRAKIKSILKNYVKITLKATTGGTVKQMRYQKVGKKITLKATPKKKYKFFGWYLNGKKVSTKASYKINVKKAATYTAKFKKK